MKKGFTLIELLAVIIILAVIALIATPVVLNVVENAKKESNKNSAYGVFNAARLYYMDTLLYESSSVSFECDGISCSSGEKQLNFSGKVPDYGQIYISDKGEISGWVQYENQTYSYNNGQLIENFISSNNILYSWSKEYYTGIFETNTFELINQLNISTIYNSFDNLYIEDEEIVADKILSKGYKLYQLTGDPSWYKNIDAIKSQIDNIYNYNIRKNNKIKGIVLDVEFYVLDEYQTNPSDVISNLITTYNEAVTYAHSKDIQIVFCLPYWLDSYYPDELEELIRISDGISIMNYNQSVLLEGITKEVELAKKYGKEINNISEFQNLDEDYITYYDEGIDKALEDWKMLSNNFKYNKLTFAFHDLNSLLELKKGYKTYEYLIKDSQSNTMTSERAYIKVVSGDNVTYFKKYSNSQGIVSIILPSTNNYNIEISLQNYDISSINEVLNTEKLVRKEVISGDMKQKYTIEYYFHLIEDGTMKDFKSKNVIIYSKDTSENFIRTTSEFYGHIGVALNYGETYYIKVFDGNNYIVSISKDEFDESNANNIFIYNKSDGTYFPADVYVKLKS